MTDISAKALAVLCAATRRYAIDGDLQDSVAVALRAAADLVAPKDDDPSGEWTTKDEIRYNLLAIAAELEGGN